MAKMFQLFSGIALSLLSKTSKIISNKKKSYQILIGLPGWTYQIMAFIYLVMDHWRGGRGGGVSKCSDFFQYLA